MKLVFSCVFLILFSCSSTKQDNEKSSYEIASVYFQKWIGGQEQTGSGINFYVKLKNPLPENVTLAKVYFQNKEGFFDKEDETSFIARFYDKPANDLILDGTSEKEYGNKAPEIVEPRFKLTADEAMIEFHTGTQVTHQKLTQIKQKELLAYPASRPRN